MFQTEYCRDEGLRVNWDNWSWPYHKNGEGLLYKNAPSADWNHNMDDLAVEWVRRWYEYWLERPGQGTRVNSGGAKIIFAESNTHARGAESYRTSGAVDAMRIPKDGYFAHKVMWDGWVDNEKPQTYIIGHWNYEEDEPTAMLDPIGRKEVIRAIRALNDVEKITIILITHYMEEAIYANKVFVMDKGRVVMQGNPHEIFSRSEELSELRLTVPHATLIADELRRRGVHVPEGIISEEELVEALSGIL